MNLNQPPSNWIPNSGYINTGFLERYPYRTFGSGQHFSLMVGLRVLNKNIDPLCGGGVHGLNIIFHPPNEFPQVFKQYSYITLGKTVSFSVEPKLTFTKSDAMNYCPKTRGCFMDSERKLRFYKHYTQHNCELECFSNFTLNLCGCVQFSMPRK